MDLKELCQKAVDCKYILQNLSTEEKNKALIIVADALVENAKQIVDANAIDIKNGKEKGLSDGLMDRLLLTEDRVKAMADGMKQVAKLPDPIGTVIDKFERPNGMTVINKRVPLGVVGVIYEARPNVTADVFALCFKTGNSTVLKGGSDAINSNIAIVKVIRETLKSINMPEDALVLIEDTSRETTVQFMKMNGYIDVLIPRGSAGLIKRTVMESTVPVIETGSGNCHTYVDESADFNMALDIIENAKTTRVGVCNACESLLIHESIKDDFLPLLARRLSEKNVEVFADDESKALMPEAKAATEEDWGKEYLALMISVKCVKNVDEAIVHINKYNTGHSECIVTENSENANKFLNGVDAACVYHNVSTRFTDGFEFGFGAEIGISTQKLHARGPMGLNALCSTKYNIIGNGQIRK